MAKLPRVQAPAGRKPAAQQRGTSITMVSGPLPAPAILAEFESVSPGAALAIIEMAQLEQRMRQELEVEAQRADIEHRRAAVELQRDSVARADRNDIIGKSLGFVIAVVALAGSVYTTTIGAHPAVSIALVSLPIAAVIKAILGKK